MIIPVGRLQENAEDDEDDVQLVEEPVEMEEDEKGTGHLKAGSVVVLSAGLYLLSQYLLRQSELQSAILIELVRVPNQSWRPERGERKTSRQMVSLWTWMRSHCEDWMRWVLTWLIIMVKHSPGWSSLNIAQKFVAWRQLRFKLKACNMVRTHVKLIVEEDPPFSDLLSIWMTGQPITFKPNMTIPVG